MGLNETAEELVEDFNLFEEEMINRFGLIPNEFKNLIELVKLKVLASKTKIITKSNI